MGIEVLDAVILRRDLPTHGLRAGDVGAVVEKYDEYAFEVEFGNGAGRTLAVVRLTADDLRALPRATFQARVRATRPGRPE